MLDLRLPLPKLLLPSKSTHSIHPSIRPSVQPSFRPRSASILPGILIPRHLPPIKQPLTIIIVVSVLVLFVVVVVGVSCVLFMPGMQPTVSHSVRPSSSLRLRWHSWPPPNQHLADHQPPAAGFATYTLAHTGQKLSFHPSAMP